MIEQSHYRDLNVLQGLNRQIQSIVENARAMTSAGTDNDEAWGAAYDLVFSDALSRRVYATLSSMNQELSYYDPDGTYEEDVEAFAYAVDAKEDELNTLLNGFNPGF